MGAAQGEEPDPALIVAKDDDILPEQAAANGATFELHAEADGMPVAAHHFAAWRSWTDMGDQFIFFNAESHNQSPESKFEGSAIARKNIRQVSEVSTDESGQRFLSSFEMTYLWY